MHEEPHLSECGSSFLFNFLCVGDRRKDLIDCERLLFLCTASRFAEPRSFLKKVLIVAVRSCYCGELLRGLQNLGASCERDVFRTFRVYEKYQKYTKGLRTSGLRGRFKALPKVILQNFPAARVETGFARKRPAKRL
jgi:hypothetical protein